MQQAEGAPSRVRRPVLEVIWVGQGEQDVALAIAYKHLDEEQSPDGNLLDQLAAYHVADCSAKSCRERDRVVVPLRDFAVGTLSLAIVELASDANARESQAYKLEHVRPLAEAVADKQDEDGRDRVADVRVRLNHVCRSIKQSKGPEKRQGFCQ